MIEGILLHITHVYKTVKKAYDTYQLIKFEIAEDNLSFRSDYDNLTKKIPKRSAQKSLKSRNSRFAE